MRRGDGFLLTAARFSFCTPRYSTGSKNKRAFQQMENISKFLDACAKLGLKANDR